MAAFKDIQIDEEGDIIISPTINDLTIDLSDRDHIIDIEISNPGEFKQYPYVGVGAGAYEKSSNPLPKLLSNSKLQLTADGYTNNPQASLDSSGKLSFFANAYRK